MICPTCLNSELLVQDLGSDRVLIQCGNAACHLAFGWRLSRVELDLLCEKKSTDRVLAEEFLEL
jgi:hypothetical protein